MFQENVVSRKAFVSGVPTAYELAVDKGLTFDYVARVIRPATKGPLFGCRSRRLLLIGLLFLAPFAVPVSAQRTPPAASFASISHQFRGWNFLSSTADLTSQHSFEIPDYIRGFSFVRPGERNRALLTPLEAPPSGMIEKVEAAFSCNDTPFVDQVRLPLATLWRGRLKLTGFESDVTTANFVLGLPAAGTLHSLGLMGSGHLATHTPPSDQLVGMHVTFYLRRAERASPEDSGLRGMGYLVRSSREYFQTFAAR